MKSYSIFSLPGDGIGAEVMAPALEVANAAAERVGVHLDVVQGLVGGIAIDETGSPLPTETLRQAEAAEAGEGVEGEGGAAEADADGDDADGDEG